MSGLNKAALALYSQNAGRLAERYEAVESDEIFAPLADLLPPPGRMVDLGAGTGRDAAWFAARGHAVTAVEPTDGLRQVGETRPGVSVEWLADSLPGLEGLSGRNFDLVLVNGVWHHLDPAERDQAICRLHELTEPGGRLLLSLRLGPDLPGQPVERMDPESEIVRAEAAGYVLAGRRDTDSVQDKNRRAGVLRTWLALDRPVGGAT